jgi:hypothetical protein
MAQWAGSRRTGESAPCAGRTLCVVDAGTHYMNMKLPPLAASMPLASSPLWWQLAHGAECASNRTNVVRITTVRDPYERFLSAFAFLEKEGRLAPFGVARRPSADFSVRRTLRLLRNETAMRALLVGMRQRGAHGIPHFVPAHCR